MQNSSATNWYDKLYAKSIFSYQLYLMQGMHSDLTVFSNEEAWDLKIDDVVGDKKKFKKAFVLAKKSRHEHAVKLTGSIGVLRWKTIEHLRKENSNYTLPSLPQLAPPPRPRCFCRRRHPK